MFMMYHDKKDLRNILSYSIFEKPLVLDNNDTDLRINL